jgi:hypothetical protein
MTSATAPPGWTEVGISVNTSIERANVPDLESSHKLVRVGIDFVSYSA